MIKTLTILSVLGATAFALDPGFKHRYDINPFSIGSSAFMDLPQNNATANDKGYVVKEPPTLPSGLEALTLWCLPDDLTVCLFYDDNGFIAGLQIAFSTASFTDLPFELATLGFSTWTTTRNDDEETYYAISQYYTSAEALATDRETRLAAYSKDTLLQNGAVWLTGFNGKLFKVSNDASDWDDFTEQNCFPWMGRHYYYKMTKTTECTAETMFPWFLLKWDGQLAGIGFGVFGKLAVTGTQHNENPAQAAVKLIVPNGPECYYEKAGDPGVITMHTYFVDSPWWMTCIGGN